MLILKKRFDCIRRNNSGDAMIVVLCIMVVLIALIMTLLMSVSTLLQSVGKSGVSERCRVMAVSFNDRLTEELLNDDDNDEGFQGYVYRHITGKELSISESKWDCYDPAIADADPSSVSRVLIAGSKTTELEEELNGYTIQTEIYWVGDQEADYSVNPETAADADYDGISLVIIVTAGKDDEIFKVQTSYSLRAAAGEWQWLKEGMR